MTNKKKFNLFVVLVNLFILFFLVDKTSSSESVYKNNSFVRDPTPQVLPAEDVVENETSVLVSKVIDGDTIELEDGRTVRYIGIDTPETTKSGECYAMKAKLRNEELVLNKKIIMEKDVSDRDRYGRLLRYVYMMDRQEKIFVNKLLVAEGYAKVATYPPDVKYQEEFVQSERNARNTSNGLWGTCTK